jgi:hypothetical protein
VVGTVSISGRAAAAFQGICPAVTDTAVRQRAADALPCSRSGPASLLGCRENASRSPVPPGDRAGSRRTAIPWWTATASSLRVRGEGLLAMPSS